MNAVVYSAKVTQSKFIHKSSSLCSYSPQQTEQTEQACVRACMHACVCVCGGGGTGVCVGGGGGAHAHSIIITDHFCTVLFSALLQADCAHVTCDSE